MKKIIVMVMISLVIMAAACTGERDNGQEVSSEEKAAEAEDKKEVKKTEAEAAPEPEPEPKIEDVSLKATDGKSIKGTYYRGETNKGIILLHMLNHDRSTWNNFATDLQDEGYHVIAIDFRGHGESAGDWKDFSTSEFEDRNDFVEMEYDIEAAASFLKGKASWPKTIIGASIGANIALRYAAVNPEVEKVVLISPGLNYKGVRTSEAAMRYQGEVLMVGSSDDDAYIEANEKLNNKFVGKHKTFEYMGSGHGTELFDTESGLSERIIGWLKE